MDCMGEGKDGKIRGRPQLAALEDRGPSLSGRFSWAHSAENLNPPSSYEIARFLLSSPHRNQAGRKLGTPMTEQYNGYGLPAAFSEISNLKAFLLWKKGMTKLNGKFDKIPYYANGQKRHGTQGEPADLANLVTLHEARIALEADPSYAGIGLALRDNLKIVALDLDNCVQDGQLKSKFSNLVSETYAEVSPSGNGVRLLLRGSALKDFKNHPEGFELFQSKGFVTLTGNR